MDEDLERFRATTGKIVETVIEAYRRRFPAPNPFDINVIVNSLSCVLSSFLCTLSRSDRQLFIINLINMLLEVRDYD